MIEALLSFTTAAHSIMPLLDVITNAADIEYDDSTEKLYQVLKIHQEQEDNEAVAECKKTAKF